MNELLLVFGMALATFLIRYPLLGLAEQIVFPELVANALKYVPVAVLAAIIFPSILIPTEDTINVSWTNPYLIGGLAASLVGWFTENMLATIVGGMCVFILFRWFLGW